ncbi:Conserved hypothetical protein [Bifidobacterium dentium Bd1]|uniref:Uncharacterized protein n=1 Tax=Bifidobacterium dentium (strain ATCC 27534 / DSM 20436 / JCM 1195 / Bd1) TaxID=401473 RepID=D2QB92_BIFDB|nr:Conserved hypothetical protein [Bifidobacterium dentium Bd1]
MYKLVQLTWR